MEFLSRTTKGISPEDVDQTNRAQGEEAISEQEMGEFVDEFTEKEEVQFKDTNGH